MRYGNSRGNKVFKKTAAILKESKTTKKIIPVSKKLMKRKNLVGKTSQVFYKKDHKQVKSIVNVLKK